MPVRNVFEELINFASPRWQAIATYVSDEYGAWAVIKQCGTTIEIFLRGGGVEVFVQILWSGEVDVSAKKIVETEKKSEVKKEI